MADDLALNIRFRPENDGLTLVAAIDDIRSDEHERPLSVAVDLSKDHGLMTVPVRLPRYLMPQWSYIEWGEFLDFELGFFQRCIDECVVHCLSLALATNDDFRGTILHNAEQVVVDFRGDLPNKYLPMMLGGYKVGVHRTGNNWPFWMSIQPTYDLALEKCEELRNEANIPKTKNAIIAVQALSNFLKVKSVRINPIQSDKWVGGALLWWTALGFIAGILAGIGIGRWLLQL